MGVGLAGTKEPENKGGRRFCNHPLSYVLGFRLCRFTHFYRAFAPSPVVETRLDEEGGQSYQRGEEVRAVQ
jgi:hypothetical protein